MRGLTQEGTMLCKTCDSLLAAYELMIRRYTNAARQLAGTFGGDFTRAYTEAERLRAACQEASDKLMDHWRAAHNKKSSAYQRGTTLSPASP